jgi:hypothetical protein
MQKMPENKAFSALHLSDNSIKTVGECALMGGYGSGGHNKRRITVEACVRIDAGMLRRAGIFNPARDVAAWKWEYSNRGRHTCDLLVYNIGSTDGVKISIFEHGNEHSQRIKISWTACNYGKARMWLHCPLCGARVFRLYYYDNTYCKGEHVHYLACRTCNRLTYDLRRERGFDKLQTQTTKYAERILGHKPEQWDAAPMKPRGMHWDTYGPLMSKWHATALKAYDVFNEQVMRLL